MAPSQLKDRTTKRGKQYKEIPTKHPYKKVCRSVEASKDRPQTPLTSLSRSVHAGRSSDPVSPVTVKREVPDNPPPPSFHQSTSSSIPRTRGSVEIMVLDSDSSDNEDNVVLSTLLQRNIGHPSKSSSTPLKSQHSYSPGYTWHYPSRTRSPTPNPIVDQPLVLSVSLANRLLHALVAESRSLTRQISEFFDKRTALDAVLRDLQVYSLRDFCSPARSADLILFLHSSKGEYDLVSVVWLVALFALPLVCDKFSCLEVVSTRIYHCGNVVV
ncbi:flocculation protein FLO11-like [Cucumis melo var. makuwa]|uniref:Flocculation protein FLO11-like n=1 Tax=Cucumis melo var. makuwa TaxID=1194695 RepID=A0A5D3C7N7_CUCMM|nr:flocculation protein FLO11-like [Cucumis melo var. makuwa]